MELLTIEEIARICQLHQMTIRRHIAEGKLRVVRIGRAVRVRKEDFEGYLKPQNVTTSKQKTERAMPRKPLTKDDSIFHLVGIVDSSDAAKLSENKYKAFPQSFSPKQ